ncbi:uncharacterized protein ARMOST_02361 [Armillaria ostoyae]|uniref:Uncharacterized protein n=1 Tax=Armillaria ostoyae TaxID=47428 RepID=A0A284QRI5_ARMOS|nr:uncharacterized protein ARMOST_02361 [Armillaria ostoyae]
MPEHTSEDVDEACFRNILKYLGREEQGLEDGYMRDNQHIRRRRDSPVQNAPRCWAVTKHGIPPCGNYAEPYKNTGTRHVVEHGLYWNNVDKTCFFVSVVTGYLLGTLRPYVGNNTNAFYAKGKACRVAIHKISDAEETRDANDTNLLACARHLSRQKSHDWMASQLRNPARNGHLSARPNLSMGLCCGRQAIDRYEKEATDSMNLARNIYHIIKPVDVPRFPSSGPDPHRNYSRGDVTLKRAPSTAACMHDGSVWFMFHFTGYSHQCFPYHVIFIVSI